MLFPILPTMMGVEELPKDRSGACLPSPRSFCFVGSFIHLVQDREALGLTGCSLHIFQELRVRPRFEDFNVHSTFGVLVVDFQMSVEGPGTSLASQDICLCDSVFRSLDRCIDKVVLLVIRCSTLLPAKGSAMTILVFMAHVGHFSSQFRVSPEVYRATAAKCRLQIQDMRLPPQLSSAFR